MRLLTAIAPLLLAACVTRQSEVEINAVCKALPQSSGGPSNQDARVGISITGDAITFTGDLLVNLPIGQRTAHICRASKYSNAHVVTFDNAGCPAGGMAQLRQSDKLIYGTYDDLTETLAISGAGNFSCTLLPPALRPTEPAHSMREWTAEAATAWAALVAAVATVIGAGIGVAGWWKEWMKNRDVDAKNKVAAVKINELLTSRTTPSAGTAPDFATASGKPQVRVTNGVMYIDTEGE